MTGMQMLTGGVACLAAGFLRGEAADVHLAAVPARSWVAFAYLVVAGSLLAYTAYAWLLQTAPLSLVTTYAFVNPLVAILLGSVFLSEPFTARTLLATALIVMGVALIIRRSRPQVTEDGVSNAEGLATPGPKGPEVDLDDRTEATCR